MKNFKSLLIMLIVSFTFSGCGGDDSTNSTTGCSYDMMYRFSNMLQIG